MSPESEQHVRQSWQLLEPHAGTFAAAFYQHLFDADPAIRHMFDGRSMEAQQLKFVDMLREIVAALDDPRRLVSAVAASGRRHGEWGVRLAHYDAVGAALIAGLHAALGPAFTDDVRHGWLEAYALLAAVMKRGAQQRTESAPSPPSEVSGFAKCLGGAGQRCRAGIPRVPTGCPGTPT